MEPIANETGFLVLNEYGAIISSRGDLQYDEKTANLLMGLVELSSQMEPTSYPTDECPKKITISYDDHCYIICLSHSEISIVKKKVLTEALHVTA